jgi:hypothetical protein
MVVVPSWVHAITNGRHPAGHHTWHRDSSQGKWHRDSSQGNINPLLR